MLTCRFADGSEIELAGFPLARALGDATTMRAEKIVLSVPDGRSVRAFINVTPIWSEGGVVVSVVVTMQDFAPLEELERLRAEFLGMVSHELRTPLAAIKGSVAAVRSAAPTLPQADVDQFLRIIDTRADHMQGLIGNLLDAGHIEAGTLSVAPEPSEVAAFVDRARSTFASGGARHAVAIDLPPELPPVMADRERVVQVLSNLLTNAAGHSPESSPIRVQARHLGNARGSGTRAADEAKPRDRKQCRERLHGPVLRRTPRSGPRCPGGRFWEGRSGVLQVPFASPVKGPRSPLRALASASRQPVSSRRAAL